MKRNNYGHIHSLKIIWFAYEAQERQNEAKCIINNHWKQVKGIIGYITDEILKRIEFRSIYEKKPL